MAVILRRRTTSTTGKIHYLANSAVVDGGANVFDAWVENDGAVAIIKMLKTTPDGVTIDMVDVVPPFPGFKVDGVALMQSGADLHVRYTMHHNDLDTCLVMEVLHGLCVPYGAEGPQLGKAGAYDGGQVVESCPTIEDIKNAVREMLGLQVGENLIGALRPHIKAKVLEALAEAQVLRVGSTADEKYAVLRHDTKDGAYEAITSYFGPKP